MNSIIENNKQWIDGVWEKIDKKLKVIAVKDRNIIPYTSVNGKHDDRFIVDPWWWTNGFWGGMMWLMYKETGNEDYMLTAQKSEELLDKAFEDYKRMNHDTGFMWHILSGASHTITGNSKSSDRNLHAAAMLASRYNVDGNYISAWPGKHQLGWTIIDCMMNLALLYWASNEVEDTRFKKIAMRHADMTLKDHIREDGSVYHVVEHDTESPAVLGYPMTQGYKPDTCWSRGSAWAIYGMMISYIHTGKNEYLEAAKKCARYFIENVEKTDYKAVIDFMAPKEPVYFDSTAGVCAACGMIEIAKAVESEEEKAYFINAAINILKATDKYFADYSLDEDALVLMGSSSYPSNPETDKCWHIPIIYGDFFYVEAILKLKGSDFFIW